MADNVIEFPKQNDEPEEFSATLVLYRDAKEPKITSHPIEVDFKQSEDCIEVHLFGENRTLDSFGLLEVSPRVALRIAEMLTDFAMVHLEPEPEGVMPS